MRSISKNRINRRGARIGYWELYYSDGNIYYRGSYKNGLKDGLWEGYYDNGNIRSKGSYKDGVRVGIWEFYYKESGELDYIKEY